MSLPAAIPASVAELVVGFLLPLILDACGGDEPASKAIAMRLLAEHQPRTGNELLLAGSAICHRLRSLAMLARSADPDLPPEAVDLAVKAACSLSRTGQQAQRRLDELRRAPPYCADQPASAQGAPLPNLVPELLAPPEPVDITITAPAAAPDDAAVSAQPGRPATAALTEGPADSDIPQIEAKLRSAETLLTLMKARWKGAPPPHSKAAQDIKVQQRLVDTGRMTLAQARRRQAVAVA